MSNFIGARIQCNVKMKYHFEDFLMRTHVFRDMSCFSVIVNVCLSENFLNLPNCINFIYFTTTKHTIWNDPSKNLMKTLWEERENDGKQHFLLFELT